MKKLVITVVLAVVCLVVVIGGLSVFGDINGSSAQGGTAEVRIASGATTADVADALQQQGLIRYPLVFRLCSRSEGFDGQYKPGAFAVPYGASYHEIMELLSGNPNSDAYVRVTIPEGSEARQIAQKLEEAGLCSADDFLAAANQTDYSYDFLSSIHDVGEREVALEGYLFPETYEFEKGMAPQQLVEVFLNQFERVFDDTYQARASELDMTIDDVVTLASVIEREAVGDEDRAEISGVFHNRLAGKNGLDKLQSCATVQYILGERKPVLSTADTQIESPYNTYLHAGLPVGPIANPGEASIEAALWPADTDALYFGLDSTGKHTFSETYEEHARKTMQ